MNVTEALDRVAEIHGHLAKGEIFRGYRPLPAALSGAVGLLAAGAQPLVLPGGGDALSFLLFWVAVAGLNLAGHAAWILRGYLREADAWSRRHTRVVVGQFLPCVLAGAALTAAMVPGEAAALRCLPGIWAVLFGLGVFASRPYLPRATGWVALWYLAVGAAVLAAGLDDLTLLGWATGLTFGLGQLFLAWVLHVSLPREAS